MRNKQPPKPVLESTVVADPETEAKVDAMMDVGHDSKPPKFIPVLQDTPETAPQEVVVTLHGSDDEASAPAPTTAPDVPPELAVAAEEPTVATSEASEPETAEESPVAQPDTAPEEAEQEPEIDDPLLAKAVDDITKAESDIVLEAEDAKREEITDQNAKRPNKIVAFLSAWWGNPIARWATFCVVLVGLVALAVVPYTRYFLLNAAGARSGASVIVVDATSEQPLPRVQVTLGETTQETNDAGKVTFTNVRLGDQKLTIERVAFAPVEKTVTIGWGSNPLGEQPLKATGAQYTVVVTDFVSGRPVTNAKATSGDAAAQADKTGKIIVTLDNPKEGTVTLHVVAAGYQPKDVTVSTDTKTAQKAALLPAKNVVYVSKEKGTYDLYAASPDGSSKKMLLQGTGSERAKMGLLTSPDGTKVAFVSSREKKFDGDNYLLDTLTIVDVSSGAATKIDQAQDIELVSWRGDQLAYRAAYAGPSAAVNDRQRLISYNVAESARATLTTANYFVAVYAVGDYIYYGMSTPAAKNGGTFGRMRHDGTDKSVLLSAPIWTVTRVNKDEMYINANNEWYKYTFSSNVATKQQQPQANYDTKVFVGSPNETSSAYIDIRDGKSVLVIVGESGKETVLANARAVYAPITWLNDTTLSYFVDTGVETAVYVASTQGGKPIKVSDATLVTGAGAGYY